MAELKDCPKVGSAGASKEAYLSKEALTEAFLNISSVHAYLPSRDTYF